MGAIKELRSGEPPAAHIVGDFVRQRLAQLKEHAKPAWAYKVGMTHANMGPVSCSAVSFLPLGRPSLSMTNLFSGSLSLSLSHSAFREGTGGHLGEGGRVGMPQEILEQEETLIRR